MSISIVLYVLYHLGRKLNSSIYALALKVDSQSHRISRLKRTQRSFSPPPLYEWIPSTTFLTDASSFSPRTPSWQWTYHLHPTVRVKLNAYYDRFSTFYKIVIFSILKHTSLISMSHMSFIYLMKAIMEHGKAFISIYLSTYMLPFSRKDLKWSDLKHLDAIELLK